MNNQTQAVTAYLRRHFADAVIDSTAVPAEKGWGYKIACAEGQFSLLVLDEAVAGMNDEQAIAQLESFQVAEVLRSMEGFTITVTNSGCIFQ